MSVTGFELVISSVSGEVQFANGPMHPKGSGPDAR